MSILICVTRCGHRVYYAFGDRWPVCHGQPMEREESKCKGLRHVWPNPSGKDYTPAKGTPCACGKTRFLDSDTEEYEDHADT